MINVKLKLFGNPKVNNSSDLESHLFNYIQLKSTSICVLVLGEEEYPVYLRHIARTNQIGFIPVESFKIGLAYFRADTLYYFSRNHSTKESNMALSALIGILKPLTRSGGMYLEWDISDRTFEATGYFRVNISQADAHFGVVRKVNLEEISWYDKAFTASQKLLSTGHCVQVN